MTFPIPHLVRPNLKYCFRYQILPADSIYPSGSAKLLDQIRLNNKIYDKFAALFMLQSSIGDRISIHISQQ
jgi:hypothetical protein